MLMMMTMDARQPGEEVSEREMMMVTMITMMTLMTRRMAMMMRAMDCRQAGEVMNI